MRRCAATLAGTAMIALAVAACGSSKSSSGNGSSSDPSSSTAAGAGSATTSASGGLKSIKAEKIGVVGVTNQSELVLNIESEIKQGAEALGWSTTVEDGQNTPSVMNSDIQNLVNQHVAAIMTIGIDANNASQALSAAQSADIPVIATGPMPSPVGRSSFAGVYSDDPVQLGTALAAYADKKTPAVKAVAQQFSLVYQAAGVITGFGSKLHSTGGSVLATQQLEGANITQSLSQTAISLMRAQPTAKYIVSGLDFAPSVEYPALKNANITGVTIMADFDDTSTMQLIRSGAPVVVAVPDIGRRPLDALSALAAHVASGTAIPKTDPAGPLAVKVIDKSNVPAAGKAVYPFAPLLASQVKKWKQEYKLP